LERFFSQGADVRLNERIGEQVLAVIESRGAQSVAMTDGILGCPHVGGPPHWRVLGASRVVELSGWRHFPSDGYVAPRFQNLFNYVEQALRFVEQTRFFNKNGSASLTQPLLVLLVKAGQYNHWNVLSRCVFSQCLEHLLASQLWHHQVKNHQIGTMLPDYLQCFFTVSRR